MKRRTFIKNSIGATITGSAVINGLYMGNLFDNPNVSFPTINIPNPYLNKLVVKPIMTNMYHTDEWEGPCRFNVVSQEEEIQRTINAFDGFRKKLGSNTFAINLANVDMLDTELIMFVEDFKITDEQYKKIEEDA